MLSLIVVTLFNLPTKSGIRQFVFYPKNEGINLWKTKRLGILALYAADWVSLLPMLLEFLTTDFLIGGRTFLSCHNHCVFCVGCFGGAAE